MRKTLLFIFITISISSIANNKGIKKLTKTNSIVDYIFTETLLGPSFSFFNTFDEGLDWGFNGIARIRIDLLDNKLSIGPQGGFRLFFTHDDEFDVSTYYRDRFYGLYLGFTLYESDNKYFRVSNLLEINHSFTKGDINISYLDNKNLKRNQKMDLFFDNSLSMALGYRITYDNFYLEAKYVILHSKVSLEKNYVDLLEEGGVEFERTPFIYFNSVNLSFGFTLEGGDYFIPRFPVFIN